MADLTDQEKLMIVEYFSDPNYPQPHGEVVALQLLAAMINSGKYELKEYPRLAEASVRLTIILARLFNDEVKRDIRGTTSPKPPVESDSMSSDSADYDPIPF